MSIDELTPEEFKQLQTEMEDRRLRELRYKCDGCGFEMSGLNYEIWNHCPHCGGTAASEVTEDASGD